MPAEQREKIRMSLQRDLPLEKRCPRCGETKPAASFRVRLSPKARRPCLSSYCLPCERAYARSRSKKHWHRHPEYRRRQRERNRATQLRRKYGITVEQYDAMFAAQGGLCAICGTAEPPAATDGARSRRTWLVVDHDHTDGAVRGLLCGNCNAGLGMFSDDADRVLSAAEYLSAAGPKKRRAAAPRQGHRPLKRAIPPRTTTPTPQEGARDAR